MFTHALKINALTALIIACIKGGTKMPSKLKRVSVCVVEGTRKRGSSVKL